MALNKTATQILSGATVAANSSSSASTGVDLSQAVDFGIGYQMTFHASATKGARVELFADPEGASVSFTVGTYADPCDSGDVDVDAGHQVQGFVQMQRAAKFVKAKVRNLDTGQSITGASLWAIVQTP
ncbi:hypothetical protein SAMN02910340_02104 [Methanosarcina thermophila]|jgi:hypothetical protein|uniref:Uncharacterized protein n=1 Tax=Methanosarcina thermophila TaxID=2210 RepID=A0A1I7AF03_METTE|nr:hypothetical protein [Methanosarcina thermophila]ALK06158.1 MAG: hypothetical protein AAY43_11275 [Methanosarcina sp. 795]SFT73511.1 hypothetical protein SAMN02910340_02104 [Methanosarcina thermophila]BAW29914.1 conserved hypothetical protein [Methanosarcina thermophila]GLI14183.1 hypothetical protein MTHERMMSTA1_13090 [Methanosarcina thermophila MST-A1]HOA69145.1 hypothetical protein [Methanosarcina thermophila]